MTHLFNQRAKSGFENSAAYDQHRPTYPSTSTDTLLDRLRVKGKHGARILDLAAGTGKFTVPLSKRAEGYEILAVEPHDEMRNVLAAKTLNGVQVVGGTAEKIPAEDEGVDAVVCAQAFHWFANMNALREIHRVLQPHGCIGCIWNIEHYNEIRSHAAATPYEAKLHDLMWTFDDSEPRFRHEKWRKVFEDQSKKTPPSLIIASDQLFALPLGEVREEWTVWLTRDALWERYCTISLIAVQVGEQRERTYKIFMDALEGPDVPENEKGEVAVHGTTYVVWSSKIPEDGRPDLTGVERDGGK